MSRANNKPSKKDKRNDPDFKHVIKDKFKKERKMPPLEAKNDAQKTYFNVLATSQIVIVEGPAGTGKSYIAAVHAADLFRKTDEDRVVKIVIARPYVTMGETTGFKPGTSLEKLYPFVRPILDAIRGRMGSAAFEIALRDGLTGDIEVQDLESIRGRSFGDTENTILLIDETQNTTPEEIQSILSRAGDNCQVILLGDPDQKDIPQESGLEWYIKFAKRHNLPSTSVKFTSDDIVRGGFVKDFIKALEADKKAGSAKWESVKSA